MGEEALITAVRSGDAPAVADLLAAGADPDSVDERGLPALCLAVEAFDQPVAEALMEAGADSLRPLPDGGTPLLRAVDSGDAGVARTLRDDDVLARVGPATRDELLSLARHWYGTGAVAELRRRTGVQGPAERVRIVDDALSDVDHVTLGGLSVRDGHGEILVDLEMWFGIVVPFGELVARAVADSADEGTVWRSASFALISRQDEETWSAAVALASHSDPVRRRFAAEVLWLTPMHADLCAGYPDGDGGAPSGPNPFHQRAAELFTDWAARETAPGVLSRVLEGVAQFVPRPEPWVLPHAAHPEAAVRWAVVHALQWAEEPGPEAAEHALLTLVTDPDPWVRENVCRALARRGSHVRDITDALAGRLDDGAQNVRAAAVYALALRDDPRCVEGYDRVGPHAPMTDCAYDLEEVVRYEMRRAAAEPLAPAERAPRS